MLIIRETGYDVYRNSLYYLCNNPVSLKLFLEKVYLKKIAIEKYKKFYKAYILEISSTVFGLCGRGRG